MTSQRSATHPDLHVFDPASFAAIAAEHVTIAMERSILARGRCDLALTGGSTPRPVYEQMALAPLAERIPWDRVAIYFGDERCVPPDDPRSNFRMADESLLSRVPIPRTSIHRMAGERTDYEAAAADYARLLPDALDILLLGAGEDGHTASLFPHSPALREEARRVVSARSPAPPAMRLTITPPVIRAARAIFVLASGRTKAAAIARALEGPRSPEEVPIQLALGGTWLLDRAAASELRGEIASGGRARVTNQRR
ncbi:MAG TPA: 6-phosphogluconolactonase [Gemmatimonadaceae bacterium]|nr:6-phosphogluconolactonase [Gemmatimonadaceae bacterium]